MSKPDSESQFPKAFECLSCHNKWTTPTLEEREDMRCPECGKKTVILKMQDINKPSGKVKDTVEPDLRKDVLPGKDGKERDR